MPPHLCLFALITFCWTRLFFGFKNTLQFLLAMYSSIRVVLKLREIIHQAIYKPITVKTFATRPSTYSDVRYVSPKSRLTPVSSLYLEDLKFNWFWSQLKLATRFHAGFLGFGKVQIRKPETFSCCCKKKRVQFLAILANGDSQNRWGFDDDDDDDDNDDDDDDPQSIYLCTVYIIYTSG